jgi:hypothetical protein
MIPTKSLAAALLLAVASGWVVWSSTRDIAALRPQLAATETAGAEAGAAFAQLEAAAVDRQLAALDRRREVSARLARARRDRVLGALGLVAAALLAAGALAIARATTTPSGDEGAV